MFDNDFGIDVGLDMSSLLADYGHIVGRCIIYCNNSCDEVDERSFDYFYSGDCSVVLTLPRNGNEWMSDEQIKFAEEILLDNIKTNICVSDLPNVEEFVAGKRYHG